MNHKIFQTHARGPISCWQDSGKNGKSAVQGASGQRIGSGLPVTTNSEILSRDAVSFVEARHMKKGATIAEVYRCSNVPGDASRDKFLGMLKCVVNKSGNTASMCSVCRIHSSCQCWVSNMSSADLLLQWLVQADATSAEDHLVLARDLKKSVGMKVRD